MKITGNSLSFFLMQLNEKLVHDLNSKFNNLNAGGCAVVAYLLAKELCSIGFNARIVWMSSYSATKQDFDKVLKENNNSVSLRQLNENNISCSHCMVTVGGKFIDSTGVHDNRNQLRWKHYKITTLLPWEVVEPIALNEYGWNTLFNRAEIPQVEQTIKNIVKDLVS